MPRPSKGPRGPKVKSEFQERVVQVDRVTRVVSGGRRMRFRATVVIGNGKGRVAMGLGKSDEVVKAVQKAVTDAKKNFIEVSIQKDTIAHRVDGKYKSSKVLLLPALPGTGLVAGGPVRIVLELAGIKNILSKAHGSANKINLTQATLTALMSLKK